MAEYEPVIGLEVHVQLDTATKIFCGCSTSFGAAPNANTCPVCLGLPGALPVMNATALRMAVRLGTALGCDVQETSVYARKNYFYPDLPKGYQISQFDRPICEGGSVTCDVGETTHRFNLTRIHLEEDAGKLIHDATRGVSYVDLNRAGTPLCEVVSEPELRSSDEAVAYLKELRNITRYLEVCDGHMERGSFRCDANVSLRPVGREALGTRTELKNLNSFNHVKRAIEYEIERQAAVLDDGDEVIQETRLWDDVAGRTRAMRTKENAHDYRYFPEPDLPPLTVTATLRAEATAEQPELPRPRRDRYESAMGLSRYDAEVLTADRALSDYFEQVLASGAEPKPAANWTTGELKGRLNADGLDITASPVPATALGKILQRVAAGKLSGKLAKKVFARVYDGENVDAALDAIGEQVTDTGAIGAEVDKVIAAHPAEVQEFRDGKVKVVGFLIGRVMQATRGRANPQAVRETLLARLGETS
ncbi:MAG: aspartyl-tRNA(Asn)/glutamyl-tRNA(Gln) amidotransferase subunit B [Myxococcota bacterium]|jgi:aspartyl-tRNA(Asn)/glutamyl-tRNA(Gln) amidotransferase subunit B